MRSKRDFDLVQTDLTRVLHMFNRGLDLSAILTSDVPVLAEVHPTLSISELTICLKRMQRDLDHIVRAHHFSLSRQIANNAIVLQRRSNRLLRVSRSARSLWNSGLLWRGSELG